MARLNRLSLNTGLVGHWTFDGKDMIRNVADTSRTRQRTCQCARCSVPVTHERVYRTWRLKIKAIPRAASTSTVLCQDYGRARNRDLGSGGNAALQPPPLAFPFPIFPTWYIPARPGLDDFDGFYGLMVE